MPAKKKAAPKSKPKAKKTPSQARKSSPAVYTDPALRDRLKAEIQAGDKGGKPGEWSARKAQLLAAAYKKAGGEYKTSRKKTAGQKHLDEWTAEGWTTRDGEPAARDGTTARYLPEKAWEELTPAQRKATDAKKRAGSRAGKAHVANTKAARKARKKTSS